MHAWYMRACSLGLKGIHARYPFEVFGPPIIPEAPDINFDFQDLHYLFCLQMVDVDHQIVDHVSASSMLIHTSLPLPLPLPLPLCVCMCVCV
jgi:hypothetical protein